MNGAGGVLTQRTRLAIELQVPFEAEEVTRLYAKPLPSTINSVCRLWRP